jgi:hypothetical protein
VIRKFSLFTWMTGLALCAMALVGCSADASPGGSAGHVGSGGNTSGSGGSTSGSGGNTSGSGGSTSGSGGDTSGSGGDSSGGAANTGGAGGEDLDASVGSGGSAGSAGSTGTGGFDPNAGYGCGDAGIPDFCDNGIRIMPPTGNSTVDKLLALTPAECVTKASNQSWVMDGEAADPDNMAGLKASICKLNGAVYWVTDMDVDCDGKTTDGKCDKAHDCCFQGDTATHGANGALTAALDAYYVIPNNYSGPKPPAGGVAAVIYKDKMVFAIFGDTGPPDIIGEGSYRLAEVLGIPPSAVNGGVLGRTVTFIAFTGNSKPANIENQAQVDALGQTLLTAFLAANK